MFNTLGSMTDVAKLRPAGRMRPAKDILRPLWQNLMEIKPDF